jgi:hypothetical protein
MTVFLSALILQNLPSPFKTLSNSYLFKESVSTPPGKIILYYGSITVYCNYLLEKSITSFHCTILKGKDCVLFIFVVPALITVRNTSIIGGRYMFVPKGIILPVPTDTHSHTHTHTHTHTYPYTHCTRS